MTVEEMKELRGKLADLEGKIIDTILLLEVEGRHLLELRLLTADRRLLVCRMSTEEIWNPIECHGPS